MNSLIEQYLEPSDSHHAVRRHRRWRDGDHAGHAASGARYAEQAHESGRAGAREDPPARARAAGPGQQDFAAAVAAGVHEDHRRQSRFEQMARPGRSPLHAHAGGLPRAGALCHLFVLPHGDADLHAARFGVLYLHRARSRLPDDDESGHVHRRLLLRRLQSKSVPQEQDHAAAGFDQARVSRRARPAADLRRIRHVGRGGFPQGQRGGWLAVRRARRKSSR